MPKRTLPSDIHPLSLVEPGSQIGARTRVGPLARIEQGARTGEDCDITAHVLIESNVRIGARAVIQAGSAAMLAGAQIEDEVFIGANAVLVNERHSQALKRNVEHLGPVVSSGASIGANATILSGINIGSAAVVGAGAVVTRNVPPHAIVAGNPARLKGYVATPSCKGRRR